MHCKVENQMNGPDLSFFKHMQVVGSEAEMRNFNNLGLAKSVQRYIITPIPVKDGGR